ncbi:immunity protein TriTu family protein [Allokutzneria albata]
MCLVNFPNELEGWFERREGEFNRLDIAVRLTRSPMDGRDKASAWVDFDSSARIGQIVVWDAGEAELHCIEVNAEPGPPEYRILLPAEDLHEAADSVAGWFTGGVDEMA